LDQWVVLDLFRSSLIVAWPWLRPCRSALASFSPPPRCAASAAWTWN